MALPRFTGEVRYRNELLLPRSLYPGVDVPPGVPCWQPIMVPMAEMVSLAIARRDRYGYEARASLDRFPRGYTLSDLDVRFDDFDGQWRRDGSYWRYRGGTIRLRLTLAIYADERARNQPRCLGMILSHELLHAADEVDLVERWLPSRAVAEVGARFGSLHDNVFQRAMRGSGDGEGSDLERAVRNLWVRESSRRAEELHRRRPGDARRIQDCMEG